MSDTSDTQEQDTMSRKRRRNRLPVGGGYPDEGLAMHRQGRGKSRDFYTVRQVADALRATGGIMSRAARKLKDETGLGHYNKSDMIRSYIDRYPELQEVMQDIESRTLDLAESKLIRAMRDEKRRDHLRAVCFYLKHKGKVRGYVGRSEVTGADGVPLYPERHIDLSRLTNEELEDLERLYAKAEIERPGSSGGPPDGRPNGSTPPETGSGNGRDPAGESST